MLVYEYIFFIPAVEMKIILGIRGIGNLGAYLDFLFPVHTRLILCFSLWIFTVIIKQWEPFKLLLKANNSVSCILIGESLAR